MASRIICSKPPPVSNLLKFYLSRKIELRKWLWEKVVQFYVVILFTLNKDGKKIQSELNMDFL